MLRGGILKYFFYLKFHKHLCNPAVEIPVRGTRAQIFRLWYKTWASCQIRKIAGCACAGMPGTSSRHRLQRKPLVSNHGMHHGTRVTHLPWCVSGSLTSGRENVPGIPGACATRKFTYLARGLWFLPLSELIPWFSIAGMPSLFPLLTVVQVSLPGLWCFPSLDSWHTMPEYPWMKS